MGVGVFPRKFPETTEKGRKDGEKGGEAKTPEPPFQKKKARLAG